MKFSKFVIIFMLTLTLVLGSSLVVYAYDISVTTSSYPDVGGVVTGTVTEAEGVYTAHLDVVSTNPGYRFIRWTYVLNNNGYHLSSDSKYDFILVDDMAIIAEFRSVHKINVIVDGMGDYVPLDSEYVYGENIVITPLPGTNYHFDSWFYNEGTGNPSNPIEFTMPNEDVEIRLYFSRDSFMLSGNVYPANSGTIYYLGFKYSVGKIVTLNANPDSGYSFVNWVFGSEVVDPVIVDNEMTFTMPNQDTVISANFIPNATVAATVKYVNTRGISIQDDEQIEIPIGPYNQTAPAISGYMHVYSLGNVGTLFPFEDPIVITHVYMALQTTTGATTESTTGFTTEPATESTTGATTESTTAPATIPISVLITVPTIVPSTGPSTETTTDATAVTTTVPTTVTSTESITVITEPNIEIITEEELPLGLPADQVEVPEIIEEAPTQTTDESEEIVLDEDVPLAAALSQTRYLPFLIFLGISGLIIFTIMWIKSRK